MEIKIVRAHTGLVAALTLAISAAASLTLPSANATPDCTVPGNSLNLHDSSGYDVAIDASGSALGPQAVIRTPDGASDWTVFEGGVSGRTIKFNAGSGKAYVHFEGTVGADGIAHGTSSGLAEPVNLAEGTWDSVDPLTCH